MVGGQAIRDVTTFVSAYLVLSLPPFLVLNRELSAEVVDLALLATVGTVALFLLAVLFVISDGVGKYTRFLGTVTDGFSVVVDLSFVLAAVSWWLVPETALAVRPGVELGVVLAAIITCQVPMLFFLSMMTVLGHAQK